MQTNEIIQQLINKINAYYVDGESFEAVFAFDGRVSPVPINKTYIAFSTNETKVNFFEAQNSETCKRTCVTIAVDFYSSPKRRARDIYALCESIMDHLMVEYAGMMTDYRADELKIDDNLRLIRLPCRMSFTFEQCPAYSVGGDAILPFADFLCKTHVLDAASHLTSEEKEYLASPLVTGTYTGNGESSKAITLGFRPKAVLVFQSGSALFSDDSNGSRSLFAVAAGSKGSKGLSITDSGFSVTNANTTAYGVTAAVNSLAQTYAYAAWR